MKRNKFFPMLLCVFFILITSFNSASAKTSDRILISQEALDNGWTRYVYTDLSEQVPLATGRGYITYVVYKDTAGILICELKLTVGFTYDNTDGIAKINSFTYGTTYTRTGYTVLFSGSSYTNGNPAIAKVNYTIYYNGGRYYNDSYSVYCYNNGSAVDY